MTEWDPSDPDAARVYYDLSEWDFEQQAELASTLAEEAIPHGWEGSELVVPEEFEATTDAVFADVEQRLGVLGKGTGVGPGTGAADATIDDDAEPEPPRVITEADTLTEYDLNEWQELERTLVTDSLAAANIPFRWEDAVLLVPTTDEERVEQIMDDVESGDVIPVINDGPDGDELPFESLNSFFLAGERLRKDPRDADGLERLLEALVIADPNRPPRGVELRTWRRTCDLAEELADALVAADADADSGDRDDDSDALDSTPDPDGLDTATRAATALHDLLRPLI